MKTLFKLISLSIVGFLCGSPILYAQSKKYPRYQTYPKFDVNLSYGIAYRNPILKKAVNEKEKQRKIAPYSAFELNYHVTEKSSVGLSYVLQKYNKKYFENYRTEDLSSITTEEHYNKICYQLFDFHFERKLGDFFSVLLGVGYAREAKSDAVERFICSAANAGRDHSAFHSKFTTHSKADAYTANLGFNSFFPIGNRIKLGISTRFRYAFRSGFESISAAPFLKINF